MTEYTQREHADMIVRMRAQIEYIEQVQIPEAHENFARCRKEGRLASAHDYITLAWDLRTDAFALQKSVDWHLDALTRDECRHSPEAPQGARSAGFTAERATLTGQT